MMGAPLPAPNTERYGRGGFYHHLTPQERDRVCELLLEGETTRETAIEVGTSKATVIRIRKQMRAESPVEEELPAHRNRLRDQRPRHNTHCTDPGPSSRDFMTRLMPESMLADAGDRVIWRRLAGRAIARSGPHHLVVEFGEPVGPLGEKRVTISRYDLTRIGGRRRMTAEGTITLEHKRIAGDLKALAHDIHAKILARESLREQLTRVVQAAVLLGVPADELPAIRKARRIGKHEWSAEERRKASDRMKRLNEERRQQEATG